MIKINAFTENSNWKKYILKPDFYLTKKIKKLNKNYFFKNKKFEFSLLLAGNKEIKNFNKKFRKKNKPTDILSFPVYENKTLTRLIKKKKQIYLGDIVININHLLKKINKKNFNIEFDKLWIHGLLHLLGYKHKLNKDYKKMNKLEKDFFKLVK